jgi:hypothetical protein
LKEFKLKEFEKFTNEVKKFDFEEYLKILLVIPNSVLKNDSIYPIFILNENIFDFSIHKLCYESIKLEILQNVRHPTLFRSNTILTKFLSFYFKLFGQIYLINNFNKFLNKICQEDENLEVNYNILDDKDLISTNIKKIEKLVCELIQILIDSVKNIPLELKYVLNILKVECEKKYSGFGLISVGGVFFLRFLSPSLSYFILFNSSFPSRK